jgi:hypothetical protein
MKSAYELAMERLEKTAPVPKLTEHQKERISEINSLYGSKIAEQETFLQGELAKAKASSDGTAVAQIQDQLNREVRRLHTEWEEKKEHVYAETPADEAALERLKTESPAVDQQESS